MRYLPLTDSDRQAMMRRIGIDSIDQLFADAPADKYLSAPLDLPRRASEARVEKDLSSLASRNIVAGSVPFFIGAGAYRHHVPATVDHLIQRSEFLTSYTPYQPEIAQGTLQCLFEFQTQTALLTGMDVANSSMYDGSTGCAEAVAMAHRVTRRDKVILSGGLHPHYRSVVQNQGRFTDREIVMTDIAPGRMEEDIVAAIDERTACVVVQTPDFFGELIDLTPIAAAAHASGALLVAVVTEVVSLGALESPGAMGADIVVAEGQSLGIGLNFGGPYVGLFATREEYVRQMPGRLCGQTTDAAGRRGFVLTLSTREQHIRRERATSNICTNAGLCCLAFSIHLSLLGEAGFRRLARINHANAVKLADMLADIPGVRVLSRRFFNEFTIEVPNDAVSVVERLATQGVLGGVPACRLYPDRDDLKGCIIIASTEVNDDDDRTAFVSALKEILR